MTMLDAFRAAALYEGRNNFVMACSGRGGDWVISTSGLKQTLAKAEKIARHNARNCLRWRAEVDAVNLEQFQSLYGENPPYLSKSADAIIGYLISDRSDPTRQSLMAQMNIIMRTWKMRESGFAAAVEKMPILVNHVVDFMSRCHIEHPVDKYYWDGYPIVYKVDNHVVAWAFKDGK